MPLLCKIFWPSALRAFSGLKHAADEAAFSTQHQETRNMTLLRRTALAAGLACGAVLALGTAHAEATFPAKPIRVVVPYGPGSGTDNSARYFTQKIAERTGWTFIIENK